MNNVTKTRYEQFVEELHRIRHLTYVRNVLDWDEHVYLPISAAGGRAEQLALLSELLHERRTDPRFVEIVQALREDRSLTDDASINVREAWREVERAAKVPASLVVAMARAESRSYNTWIQARRANDFSVVKEPLTELLALKREHARCLALPGSPYNSMLDLYEPGLTDDVVAKLFHHLGKALREILLEVVAVAGAEGVPNPARAPFPRERQREVNRYVADLIGFDFSRGRIDETIHPFCSEMGFDDVRLTTRFHEDDASTAMYSTLHEAGHGIYEQGYLREHAGTALAEFCSLAVHESQSRIWENNIGRSKNFLFYLYPYLQREFPEALSQVSFDDYYRYINRVRPSLIRVEADEVSYGLHIIIRFELEQDLVNGSLEVSELPDAWNAKYQQHLGIQSADDLHGVLQDVHWYGGSFGYFPTYLMGTSYAAQLHEKIKADLPDYNQAVSAGEFASIKGWLNRNIHSHGKRFDALTLIERASGAVPSADYLISYLKQKFGEIYALKWA